MNVLMEVLVIVVEFIEQEHDKTQLNYTFYKCWDKLIF